MNHLLRITGCAIAAMVLAHAVGAQTAGTVLFAQAGTQIVSASGAARAAKKGDVLQTGDRLLTPAGAISQVLLPDGSLIGMRPDSELKITAAPLGSDNKAPVLALVNGAARVIGAELMDSQKVSNLTLQSGTATVQLKGADMESAVVKADALQASAASGSAPGSYQRLLLGTGTVANGAPGVNPVANLTLSTSTPVAQPVTVLSSPLTSIKLPTTTPVVTPCTRLLGKTCIQ